MLGGFTVTDLFSSLTAALPYLFGGEILPSVAIPLVNYDFFRFI